MNPKYFVLAFFGFGLTAFIYTSFFPKQQNPHSVQMTADNPGAPLARVSVPALAGTAEQGRVVFEANCASCHGVNAAGQDGVAPPLVHKIYEPNHHANMAFQLAVKNGVRSHHWRFGNMPQIEGVSEQDVDKIIAYVRTLQRENGIF